MQEKNFFFKVPIKLSSSTHDTGPGMHRLSFLHVNKCKKKKNSSCLGSLVEGYERQGRGRWVGTEGGASKD